MAVTKHVCKDMGGSEHLSIDIKGVHFSKIKFKGDQLTLVSLAEYILRHPLAINNDRPVEHFMFS